MGRENCLKKLLVEGSSDQHVVWALCKMQHIPETFDVINCEGFPKLIDAIPVRLKSSGIKTLGIVVDADLSLENRWLSLRATLLNSGVCIPESLPESGLIVEGDALKVGVWIMPDNNTKGMLEDFISFLVPDDDKLMPVVNTTLSEIESKDLQHYNKETHRSKAKIHTWLAWQEDPGTPMGLSITKRYLSTEQEIGKAFTSWLTELFKE